MHRSATKRFLFSCPSGYGYLYPAMALAHLLQARGHHVHFVMAAEYQQLLQMNGLSHDAVHNTGSSYPFCHPGHWFQPQQNQEQLAVLQQSVRQQSPDVIVTSPLSLSALAAAELASVPTVVIGFGEYLFPGAKGEAPERAWRLKEMTAYYNTVRQAAGLSAVKADPTATPLLGDLYLLRSIPELLGDVSLPHNVELIGSCLYTEPPATNIPLQRFVRAQRAQGRPLIYAQIGRLFEAKQKWTTLMESLAALPYAVVADVARQDYLDASGPIPANIYLEQLVPLGSVAEDTCCVLSSGHTTSLIAALSHRLPLLIVPHSDDARETAIRFADRGVAIAALQDAQLGASQLAQSLEALRLDSHYRAQCARLAQRFVELGSEARVVAAVEAVARPAQRVRFQPRRPQREMLGESVT